ncbi:MAG: hypothetical protein HEP71_30910 [Roseivirga sp.]|nr:hypothetical protein [Roseivirga sp.]
MKPIIVIPSQHYPVTLEEAKKQLGFFHSEEDAEVAAFIADATAEAEEYTGITALFKTVEQAFDCFPAEVFELRGIPCVKIESVQYYDTDDNLQVLDPGAYRVTTHSEFARLQAVNGWPSTKGRLEAVIIRYVVGHAGVGTANSDDDTIEMIAHPFTDGKSVFLTKATEAEVPGGLSLRKPYYVVNAQSDSFQVSATAGGSAIDITSNGDGQLCFCLKEVPRQLTSAIKRMVSDFEQFRGDYLTGTIVQSVPASMRLLNQIKPKRL